MKKTEVKGNYIESVWYFFSSVRLTVVILLAMASFSIIGTLIPQNKSPAEYFNAFGPFFYQVLATLDIFDMYRSWWFQGLMSMLVMNIIICSIDRLQTTGKIIFTKKPKFNLENYRRKKIRKNFCLEGDVETIKERYKAILSRRYGYCEMTAVGKGFAIMAEKGRWTRLGVYGVHLSIVILLIGSLIGSIKGFEGFVNINEGEATDTIQLRFADATLKLPFTIRCDNFDVQFYDTGAPKEFRSKLTIIENGQSVYQKDIIVNDPLRYKGINIFQSSYGKTNNPESEVDVSKQIELSFKSKASGMIYNVKASLNKPIDIPEGLGRFVINDYHQSAQFRGMALGPALQGTLTLKEGKPQPVLLPMRYPKFDGMRKGDVFISVIQSEKLFEEKFYTGLQITKDPGVDLVYAGFILMIIGCMVTFFMSHEQIVVEIKPSRGKPGNKIDVMVSGRADKNKIGFQNKLEKLSEKLVLIDKN